jgi:hypothetical protein
LRLQFAILHDAATIEPWQLRCVEQLIALADAHPACLITRRAPAARSSPLPTSLASLPAITLAATSAGGGETMIDAALEDIRRRDLDFILSYLSEPCPPDLLDAARHGVWTYQLGDWLQYRGDPGGFWEVYDGAPVTGVLLVRLQRAADAVVVLRDGYFRTHLYSHRANRERLLRQVSHWPAQVCTDIRNGVSGRLTSAPLATSARARTAPTRAQRVNFKCRIALRAIRMGLRSLFRHDQWNIGYVDRPISSFLRSAEPATVKWLAPSNRSEFQADPFGIRRDGRLTIFYEHFSYRNNRGTIAAIDPAVGAAAAVQIGPKPAVHLSYPYLVEADGRVLCIPESYQAAEVGLYELERFPDRWVKIANLLDGIAIVDATLFRHEGRWWLAGSEPTDSCALNLWHASAIAGPWHPHAGNPVKMDIRSSRPAGTPFHEGDALYRPAQDCSRTYGGRVVIHRILTLTPTAFEERPVGTVEPDPAGPYPAGLHTLSAVGGGTLLDGKRVIFSPAEFRRVFLHHLRSLNKLVRR